MWYVLVSTSMLKLSQKIKFIEEGLNIKTPVYSTVLHVLTIAQLLLPK